jgi:hypothetical protein
VTATITQLTRGQQQALERARKALEASQADTDTANYPRHLGRLEVTLADVIELIESLADGGSN